MNRVSSLAKNRDGQHKIVDLDQQAPPENAGQMGISMKAIPD